MFVVRAFLFGSFVQIAKTEADRGGPRKLDHHKFAAQWSEEPRPLLIIWPFEALRFEFVVSNRLAKMKKGL